MKRVLFALLAVVVSTVAFSQSRADYSGRLGSSVPNALDTIANAETTAYEIAIDGAKNHVTFQVNVTKVSGTVAGTIRVYASADGINYATTHISTTALVDATQNYVIPITGNPYRKYKLEIVTTGTVSAIQKSYVLYRK